MRESYCGTIKRALAFFGPLSLPELYEKVCLRLKKTIEHKDVDTDVKFLMKTGQIEYNKDTYLYKV